MHTLQGYKSREDQTITLNAYSKENTKARAECAVCMENIHRDICCDPLAACECNCPGMNALELKEVFGKDLAFIDGVDTQEVLPNGTKYPVRKATAELLEGMTADGGGYIFAASHTVPPETPDDKTFAMCDEAGITREEIFDRAPHSRNAFRA